MGCFVYGDVLVSAVLIYDELYMSLSDAIVLEDFFKQRKITLVRKDMDVNNQIKYNNIAFIAVLHFSVTLGSSRLYLSIYCRNN